MTIQIKAFITSKILFYMLCKAVLTFSSVAESMPMKAIQHHVPVVLVSFFPVEFLCILTQEVEIELAQYFSLYLLPGVKKERKRKAHVGATQLSQSLRVLLCPQMKATSLENWTKWDPGF